jgi:hypothetical protein
MSEMNNLNGSTNGTATPSSDAIKQTSIYSDTIFQRLEPREVEQFYKSYHFWLLQRRIQTLHTEASAIQQAIIDNTTLMQQVSLSAIALASLAQLQASGVSDLDLLDRMLERGETWLDHTMQLLEHCEKLDVIRGDYTQWCEHALEGAYDWIESMEATEAIHHLENDALSDEPQARLHTATEEQLLQKLMSDEDATEKIAALNSLLNEARERTLAASTRKITQPLDQPAQATPDASLPTRKITQPLDQATATTPDAPSPMRKITQPLDQGEVLIETELPAETAISTTEQIEQANTASAEISFQPETLFSEEDTEQTTTMPALTIKQVRTVDTENNLEIEDSHRERSEQIDTMEHFTETPDEGSQKSIIQEVAPDKTDDTKRSEAASAETSTEVTIIRESPQENKKPQLQKVRRRGFWRLLNRLLAFILRR